MSQRPLLFLCVLSIGLFLGCGREALPTFKVGMLADLDTPGGQPSVNAVELAISEINKAGGVAICGEPHLLELLVLDTKNNPSDAMDAARHLLFKEHVRALIGPNVSRNAIPAAAVAESAQVPMISPGSSHPQTTAGKKFVFRLVNMDDLQGSTMASFALEKLKSKRAVVLYDAANPSIKTVVESFQSAFSAQGGQVLDMEAYATGKTQFQDDLKRLLRQEPDLVFLPNNFHDLEGQAAFVRAAGFQGEILGSDAWSPHLVEGNPSLEGAWFCHHWHPSMAMVDTSNQEFVRDYTVRFKQAPKVMSALSYDALGLLAWAIEQSDGSSKGLRDVIAAANYDGITGKMSFYEGGNPSKDLMILRLKQGTVAFQERVAPARPVQLAGKGEH